MILLAIPTIKERPGLAEETAQKWVDLTPEPLTVHITTYGPSWAAGLNDAWRAYPDAEGMVCGSDDMTPESDTWLTHVLEHLDKDECPVPTMHDPRMTTIGGTQDVLWRVTPSEGAQAKMTNFPILKRAWYEAVFPLPEDLHYYSDNLISDRLRAKGIPLVTCLDIEILHAWDQRGRDESARMLEDRRRYQAL